ncbi:MAG: enolase C-terminal domain-like protein, partial [Prevotellamassilia sp.]|nr:enolase C-terminal domain-like protein [Prevotellamassilia sp.]
MYTHRQVWYVFISESPIDEDTCHAIIADSRLLSAYKIGVGEIAPLHDLSCEYGREFHKTIDKCCREFVASNDTECLRHYPSIRFGIETAMRSLHVHDGLSLFDTAFTRGERGIPINGLVWMGDKETMRQRMLSKMQAGFTCIKIKIGTLHIEEELALLKELRQIAPSKDLQIRVDANGAFTEEKALEVMEQLAKLEVHSIEQPLRSGNWDSMARLCKSSPIPIALDEELIGVNTPKLKEQLLQEIHPAY